MGEIDLGLGPQEGQELLNCFAAARRRRRRHRDRRIGMAVEPHQLAGDFRRRQNIIHPAVVDGAARHAVVLGGLLVLGEGHASLGLHRLEAERAVGPFAGQDDADGAVALRPRQGAEQVIDRHVQAVRRPRLQRQLAAHQRHALVRRDQEDLVRLDRHSLVRLDHRHVRDAAEDLRHVALESRLQMDDDQERHIGRGRNIFEEAGQCFEPAGRRPDAHDREGELGGDFFRMRRRTISRIDRIVGCHGSVPLAKGGWG